jgi:hypothetical protein
MLEQLSKLPKIVQWWTSHHHCTIFLILIYGDVQIVTPRCFMLFSSLFLFTRSQSGVRGECPIGYGQEWLRLKMKKQSDVM